MTMLPASPESARADLRAWRLEHDLRQKDVADLLGVTWLTVQRWEAGTRAMPPYLFLALREVERQLAATDT